MILWFARRWLLGIEKVYNAGDGLTVVGAFLKFTFVCAVLFVVFFFHILTAVSERMTGFLFPEVNNVEVRPQYSIAEARVCEGKYEEAISEFRKVWDEYPNDVNAHVRIADIQCQHFKHNDEAIRELRAALAKKCKPEAWAFVANRLVDVQVEYLRDFVGARETLQQIMLKFPSSRYAESAMARVLALNDKEAHGKKPPRQPLKVPEINDGETW